MGPGKNECSEQRGPAVTAPTKNAFHVDTRQVPTPMSDPEANNRAVERVITLLNEVIEKGALPAL
jgi:hypothetical protein